MEVNFGIGLVMIPVVLFIFMLPIALLVALQVWLCKRSPKMGLILPGVSLALSLLLTLSMASWWRGVLTQWPRRRRGLRRKPSSIPKPWLLPVCCFWWAISPRRSLGAFGSTTRAASA